MGRIACVSVFGNVEDIERDWGWLQHWLPATLGEREMHWAVHTSAQALPETNPDIAVFLGTMPQSSQLFHNSFRIWIQTPQPALQSNSHLNPPPLTTHPLPGDAAVAVKIWLEPGSASGESGIVDMVISPGYRLLLGSRTALQQQTSNGSGHGGDLWGVVLSSGPGDYAQSAEVTLWMREQPILENVSKVEQRLASLNKPLLPKLNQLHTRYVQAMWMRHESACLATAIALRKVGLEELARTYLWRLIGPLNVEPNAMTYIDEKGVARSAAPTPPSAAAVPTGMRKRGVYELVESWLADKSDPTTKHRQWAKSLVWKFASEWANDPKWLSFMMICHSPLTPYVTGTNHEQNIAQLLIYGGDGGGDRDGMMAQLQQFTEVARFQLLPTPKWCIDLKSALSEASQTSQTSQARWSLVVDASATFGPMFMRDWDAIISLIPKITPHWDLIQLGYSLPAYETTVAMCNTKPKTLTPLISTFATGTLATGAFAFCLNAHAAKNLINKISTRVLTLSSPTIFLPIL